MRKKAMITFRNKQVQLKYTLAASVLLEEHGINLSKEFESEGTVKEVITFVLAGLITDFPDATFQEVATAFNMKDMGQLALAIAEGVKKVK